MDFIDVAKTHTKYKRIASHVIRKYKHMTIYLYTVFVFTVHSLMTLFIVCTHSLDLFYTLPINAHIMTIKYMVEIGSDWLCSMIENVIGH